LKEEKAAWSRIRRIAGKSASFLGKLAATSRNRTASYRIGPKSQELGGNSKKWDNFSAKIL
jgi:hypothetical protein